MASTSLDNLATSSSTLCTESSHCRLPKALTLDSLLGQNTPAEPEKIKPVMQYLAPPVQREQYHSRTDLSCRQLSVGEEISTTLVYNPSAATGLVPLDTLRATNPLFSKHATETVRFEVLPPPVEHKPSTNSASPAVDEKNPSDKKQSAEFNSLIASSFDQIGKNQQAAMYSSSNSSETMNHHKLDTNKNPETKSEERESLALQQSGSKKKVRWLQIHDFCNYTLEQKYSGSLKELSVAVREADACIPTDCLDGDASTKLQTVSTPTPKISPSSDHTGSVFSLQENLQQSPARVSPSKACLLEIDEIRSRHSGTTSQRTPRAGILKNKARVGGLAREDQTSAFSQSASRDNVSQLASEISEPANRPVRARKPEVSTEVPTILEQGDEDSPLDNTCSLATRSSKDFALIGALVFFACAIFLWEACATQ